MEWRNRRSTARDASSRPQSHDAETSATQAPEKPAPPLPQATGTSTAKSVDAGAAETVNESPGNNNSSSSGASDEAPATLASAQLVELLEQYDLEAHLYSLEECGVRDLHSLVRCVGGKKTEERWEIRERDII